MDRARYHALRGWTLHRELPEAASLLVDIVLTWGGEVQKEGRFWFDEAVQADLRCRPAYQLFAFKLRPRWGGSHALMLGLGREYLATQRFDTDVPLYYRQAASDVAEEAGGWTAVLRMPGVYQDFLALTNGYIQAAKDDAERNRWRSQFAAIAFLAGDRIEARRVLQGMGNEVDRAAFDDYGVSYSDVRRRLTDWPQSFQDDPGGARHLEFLTGSERLLTDNLQGAVSVWDVAARTHVRELREHGSPLVSLERRQELLLSASHDGKLVIWDAETLEPLHQVELGRQIHAAAWYPDGREVLIAAGEATTTELITWTIADNKQAARPIATRRPIHHLATLPQMSSVFFSVIEWPGTSWGELFYQWDGESEPRQMFNGFEGGIMAWRLTDDGKLFISGLPINPYNRNAPKPSSIFCINPADMKSIARFDGLPTVVRHMQLLDSGRLAAVGDGTSVAMWNIGRSEMERVARAQQPWSNAFAVSSNGEQLASLDDDGKIHVQSLADLAKGWSITTPLVDTNLGESIAGISFDLEGQHLSIASTTGGVSHWDLSTGARRAEHLAPVPVVLDRAPVPANRRSVALDPMVPYPNGERYVRISRQENGGMAAQVFAAPAGKLDSTLALEGRAAACVAVSPDSRIVAIGDESGAVTLFDGQSYTELPWGKLREHAAKVQCISFSPDGARLVTASADGVVKCWEVPLPAQREGATQVLKSRSTIVCRGAPQSVAIASQDAQVAVSIVDTEVYDAANGNRLYVVPGTTCAFGPDGALLITGGISARRTAARVWNATTGAALARLDGGHAQAITCLAISPDGSIAITGDQEGYVRAWNTKTGEELLAFPETSSETQSRSDR